MLVKLLQALFAIFVLFGIPAAARAGCTTLPTSLTLSPSSSYDVQAILVAQVSGSAGLSCSGSTLSLLGGSRAKATVTSSNDFQLSAGGLDLISYQASADSAGTVVFTQGSTVDYMNPATLSLLGIGSAGNFTAPLYVKLLTGPNVAAGTYTDTLTVKWDYSVCSGVQIGSICLGYEAAKVTTIVTVTLVVGNDCRITAPHVSFGVKALVSQFVPVNQAALVDCTKGSTYKISFSTGQNGSARPWQAMTDGAGHSLQYNIYQPDGWTIWDQTNPLASTSKGTGSTTASQVQNYVVKVNPAQATPMAGSYTDSVSVIITF